MSIPPGSDYEWIRAGARGAKFVRHALTSSVRCCRSYACSRTLPDLPAAQNAALEAFRPYESLTHPFFVKYVEAVVTPRHLFLLSDPLPEDAISLSALIARWRGRELSEVHVLFLFSQILLAIVDLHSRSPPLVHGDLSAETVYVTSEHSVRLSEFGARAIAGHVRRFRGSGAAPPEEADGSYDTRSDIWALGAILYQLCTGRILGQPIAKLPTDLNDLFLCMVSRDPAARPTALEVAAAPVVRSFLEWFVRDRYGLKIPRIGGGSWSAVPAPKDKWTGLQQGHPPPRGWRSAAKFKPLPPPVPAQVAQRRIPWVATSVAPRPTDFVPSATGPIRTVHTEKVASNAGKQAGSTGPVRQTEQPPTWASFLPAQLQPEEPADEDEPDKESLVRAELRKLLDRASGGAESTD
jgi:serine/threonine protein kinase